MTTYSVGTWFGLVTGRALCLLEPSVDVAVVRSVYEALEAGADFGRVLERFTAAFGTDLAAIPSFVVITLTDSETRIVARGPISVSAAGESDTVVVSGLGVTTWSERVVPVVSAITIAVDGVQIDESAVLPVSRGVVLCAAVFHETDATVSKAPPVTAAIAPPATVVQKVPVLEPTPAIAEAMPAAVLEDVPEREPEPDPLPSEATLVAQPVDDDEPQGETVSQTIAEQVDDDDEYDQLWGETVFTDVVDAVVHLDETTSVSASPSPSAGPVISGVPSSFVAPPLPPAPLPDLGDHDGETLSIEQLQAMMGAGAAQPVASAGVRAAASAGRIVLSTGPTAELDRGAIIGRKPRVSRVSGEAVPHLIAVDSPTQDISRSHVEIQRQGGDALAVDLNTTNGTRLVRAGKVQRLHPGEATLLVDGDVLDIGDGVTVQFEAVR